MNNKLKEPILSQSISAVGNSFVMHVWKGSGPPYMHVHYEDDEAWHILEGTLAFTFIDRTVEATKGTTVFVPFGVAHTYTASDDASYLVILTSQLNELIAELHNSPLSEHVAIMQKYKSEIL